MGIKQCDDGNTEDGDGCSSRCAIEEGWECEGGSALSKDVCIDVVPPTMLITRNKNNSLLTIKFNEGVIFSGDSDNITAEFINYIKVKIIKVNKDEVIIPWELKEIPIFSLFKEFKIHPIINFTTSGSEKLVISIGEGNKLVDNSGNIPLVKDYETNLAKMRFIQSGAQKSTASSVSTISTAATTSVIVSVATSMVVSSSIGSVLSLVQYMQIAQYVNMISIDSPQIFTLIYSKADLMSNVNLNFTFIKNPFKKFTECSSLREGSKSNILWPSFMYNTGNQIFIWGLLLLMYGISVLVVKYFPKRCVKIRKFFQELYNSFFYSLPIEMFNEVFMTIAFYAFLNLFQACYKCYTYYIDIFTSSVFLMLCGVFYFWVNFKIPLGLKRVTKAFSRRYDSLYRDVPLLKGFYAIKLLSISLSFKITYALALAALIEYPVVQVLFAISLNGMYVTYLIIVRPYSTIKLNYISIFNYSCLQIILVLKLVTYYALNESNEMGFGVVMSLLFLLPISQSLIIFGIDYYFSLIKSIYFKIKGLVQACRNKKIKATKKKEKQMSKLVF